MKLGSIVRVTVAMMVLALTVSATAGTAQFGVKAGLSRAAQTWEYTNLLGTIERDTRTGLAFGIFADVPFTPIIALRVDVLYVQKGSHITIAETSENAPEVIGSIDLKERVDYLSLSLTGKANLLSGPLGIYLLSGPRLDIKVGGKFELSGPSSDSLYNSTVFGLVLGGGVEKSIGPGTSVLLEFRYDLDLTDASEYAGSEADLVVKNRGFLILAGLRF